MMTKDKFTLLLKLLAAAVIIGLVTCSNKDEDKKVMGPTYPDQVLVAKVVTTPPADDATIDGLWSNAEAFVCTTVIPPYDVNDASGTDIWWDNYEGQQIVLTMKAVYDATNIYFLAQWNDAEDSKTRQAWYFNQTGRKWLQMGKKHPDEFGKDPAYEDKFTMFWNISIANFDKTGCATLCHGAKMATNVDGEIADTWHWKRDRTGPVSQLDDKWLAYSSGGNGRKSDAGTGAYKSNVQSLVTSVGDTVSAPMYWIPNKTDYHWILKTEIDDGTAKKITDLNADTNWVDEDGTVLDKSGFGYSSTKVIPSLMQITPATGSRGDVSAYHSWSNGTWTLKIKRARNTGNSDDVQFTDTGTPYWFSVGIMDKAAIAHATPGGMVGTAYPLYLEE